MRIITCASYFATGSSAVTDYCMEYKDVSSVGRYEYRFLQDPDGVSDLEYNIVENNHRHNTSNAIKRYLKFAKSLHSFGYGGGYDVFGKEFDRLTREYIDEITELKVKTWWIRDRVDKGELFCYADRFYSLGMRLLHGGLHTEKKYSLLKNTEDSYYSAIGEEEFLKATRKYVDRVISVINKEKTPFVMVDQMVPPTNTARFTRYFNDVKIVVVDRDPRDVYLSEIVRYHWGVVPTQTVEDYVKWFLITRKYSRPENEDKEKVLRIQFEDMIYRYGETTEKICAFIGLNPENHIAPRSKFDPARSIKNTNLKYVLTGYEKDIEYIEKHLKDYLYDFERYM